MNRHDLKRCVVIGLCVTVGVLLGHCGKGPGGGSPGPAPDFTLTTLQNQKLTLSQLRGSVVLLDFWATWCGPCRESLPHLVHLYKTFQAKGFEIVGMSMDKGEETVRRYIQSMDVPYPIVMASEDVAGKYGVTALPTTFLIDRQGKLRQKISGYNPAISKEIAERVSELLSEKP